MKTVTAIIFSFLTTIVLGQTSNPVAYYLNGELIDIENVHIKTSNIQLLDLDKKSQPQSVSIKTKTPFNLLTLDEVASKNGLDVSTSQIVYTVNGKLISDKSKIRIDASYYIQADIKSFAEVVYIDDLHKQLILVDIKLFDEKPQLPVRIRGTTKITADNSEVH